MISNTKRIREIRTIRGLKKMSKKKNEDEDDSLWKALSSRDTNNARDEDVLAMKIPTTRKGAIATAKKSSSGSTFVPRQKETRTLLLQGAKDGNEFCVVRFGVVQIDERKTEEFVISNDTSRAYKVRLECGEKERDGMDEYEVFCSSSANDGYDFKDDGVRERQTEVSVGVVPAGEQRKVRVSWKPKRISEKATKVSSVKVFVRSCATDVFDEGKEKMFSVRVRGVTIEKTDAKQGPVILTTATTTTSAATVTKNDNYDDDDNLFYDNKENVIIEDDEFDEVYEGYKGLPSEHAAKASWRRNSNKENLEKYLADMKKKKQDQKAANDCDNNNVNTHDVFVMPSLTLQTKKGDKSEEKSANEPITTTRLTSSLQPSTSSSSSDFESAREFASQQEAQFMSWLNRTISPIDEEAGIANIKSTSSSYALDVEKKKQKEREFRNARQISRNVMTELYAQDPEVGVIMREVESRIERKLIRLKSDGGIFLRDLAMKQDFIKNLSAVNTFWLKLAVDAVMGDTMRWQPQNPKECAAECVAKLFRVIELEIDYGLGEFSCQPPFADGYENALNDCVLQRILLLVLLLDRAQSKRNHPKAPKLFIIESSVKSTKVLAENLLTASCYGEGDIMRNLQKAGFVLSYEQTPISEYDFTVKNLAIDLRDGVRLCQLIQTLEKDVTFASINKKSQSVIEHHSLLSECTFPAKTRDDKLKNVRLALNAAKDVCNVTLPGAWSRISPADIVDGVREATCGILWAMMTHYTSGCGSAVLPRNMLAKEILNKNGKLPNTSILDREVKQLSLKAMRSGNNAIAVASRPNGMPRCGTEALLLAWAKACCAKVSIRCNATTSPSVYTIQCTNLGSDFADGRVLLAILRTYAPGLTGSRRLSRENLQLNHPLDMAERRKARDIAAKNFLQVSECLKSIGGVPLPGFDIRFFTSPSGLPSALNSSGGFDLEKNIPDPQTSEVTPYLLCLCSRVIQHVQRVDSAKTIQRWWRLRRPNRPKVADVAKRWSKAQTIISKHLRGWFVRRQVARFKKAVCACQSKHRGRMVRKKLQKQHDAATQVQRNVRMFLAQKVYHEYRKCVINCQKSFRAKRATLEANVRFNAAMAIQAAWRAWFVRKEFLAKRVASVEIQRFYRGHLARKRVETIRKDLFERKKRIEMEALAKERRRTEAIESELKLKELVENEAAKVITGALRTIILRNQFRAKQVAVEGMQKIYRYYSILRNKRNKRIREREEEDIKCREKAAFIIQTHYREYCSVQALKAREFRKRREEIMLEEERRAKERALEEERRAKVRALEEERRAKERALEEERRAKERALEKERRAKAKWEKHNKAAIRIQRHVRGYFERIQLLESNKQKMASLLKECRSCSRKDVKRLIELYRKIANMFKSRMSGQASIENCFRCPDSISVFVETMQMFRDYENEYENNDGVEDDPFLLACNIFKSICLFERSKFCEEILKSNQYSRDVARCRKIKDTSMYLSLANENRANILESAMNDNDEDLDVLKELRKSSLVCKKRSEELESILQCLKDASPASVWEYAQTPKKTMNTKGKTIISSIWGKRQRFIEGEEEKAAPSTPPPLTVKVSKINNIIASSPPVRQSPRLLALRKKY